MIVEVTQFKGMNVIDQEIVCSFYCYKHLQMVISCLFGFRFASCVIKPSECWPLGFAVVTMTGQMEEYGIGGSFQHNCFGRGGREGGMLSSASLDLW